MHRGRTFINGYMSRAELRLYVRLTASARPPQFFCTPLCGRYAPVVNHLVATTTTRATALLGSFQTHLQLFCDALALGHELWDDLRLLPQVLQLLGEVGGETRDIRKLVERCSTKEGMGKLRPIPAF